MPRATARNTVGGATSPTPALVGFRVGPIGATRSSVAGGRAGAGWAAEGFEHRDQPAAQRDGLGRPVELAGLGARGPVRLHPVVGVRDHVLAELLPGLVDVVAVPRRVLGERRILLRLDERLELVRDGL